MKKREDGEEEEEYEACEIGVQDDWSGEIFIEIKWGHHINYYSLFEFNFHFQLISIQFLEREREYSEEKGMRVCLC